MAWQVPPTKIFLVMLRVNEVRSPAGCDKTLLTNFSIPPYNNLIVWKNMINYSQNTCITSLFRTHLIPPPESCFLCFNINLETNTILRVYLSTERRIGNLSPDMIIWNLDCIIHKDVAMKDKPLSDVKTFIENVNKRDKTNGKKVVFNFVKRKRK